MLCEVTSPPKIKDFKDFDSLVMTWEAKTKKLKDLFRDELSDGMLVAVFTNMLPASMQDHVYTTIDKDTTYENLRDRMRVWVSNEVSQGPVPMDQSRWTLGHSSSNCPSWTAWAANGVDVEYIEEETEVEAVDLSGVSVWSIGGVDAFSRWTSWSGADSCRVYGVEQTISIL